jgi:phage gp36-like protein
MAYSTVEQVQAEFRKLDIASCGTAVITAEVEEFIEEADSIIDSIIGKRYEVPVTGASSLKILRYISRNLAADRIRGILVVRQAPAEELKQDVKGGPTRSELMKMLYAIANGDLPLTDAVIASTGQGVTSFAIENDEEHVFKKNVDQW